MNDTSQLVKCSHCGEMHDPAAMEVAFGQPDDYFALAQDAREQRGQIGSDFCRLDGRYFIRCVAPIPVVDSEQNYSWGIWVEISKDDFRTAQKTWEDDDVSHIPRIDAKLANSLREYKDSKGLKGEIELRSDSRPFFYILQNSRFQQDQNNGITNDDISRYYHYFA